MPERRLKTQRIRGDNERHRFTDSLESYVFEGGEGEGRRGARGNEKRGHDLSLVRIRFENATSARHTSLYHPQFPKCIKRIKFSSSWPPLSCCPLITPFSLDPPRWKSWWRCILSKGGSVIDLMEFSFCQWDGILGVVRRKSSRANYCFEVNFDEKLINWLGETLLSCFRDDDTCFKWREFFVTEIFSKKNECAVNILFYSTITALKVLVDVLYNLLRD